MTAALLSILLLAAPEAAAANLPTRIDGWKLESAPTHYTPETIFDYIDGGAEAFLQFDFQELTSAIYVNAKKVEITADVYRHADASRAFGIYSQERRPGSPKMPGGFEGVAGDDHLELVVGAYYVKLALPAGGDSALLPRFADKIAAKLPGPRELPLVLACFPEKGKKPRSEKLTARDFLGRAFLHDAAAVPYEIDGVRFRLFAVKGKDAAEVRNMVGAWRAVAKLPQSQVGPRGRLVIKDPHNGEVSIMWADQWLWGAIDNPAPQALLDELGDNLNAALRPRAQ
jgi:hypothetical protein